MTVLTNAMENNALASLVQKASGPVLQAIKGASAKTGVNFAYLVQQAAAESSFNPVAKAATSSASGLYQFIESTWLSMVDKYGEKYGIATDGKSRSEILGMRNDPKTASLMAAEFAGENEKFLKSHWGGKIGSTELYFAHFMGAGGASAFLQARDENPLQEAALLFPKAAKANRNVFYDQSTGRAKTLDEVYAFFDKKFSNENIRVADVPETRKPAYNSVVYKKPQASYNIYSRTQDLIASPLELMLLAQMDLPIGSKTNSWF